MKKVPGAMALYQVVRPPPEARITRWLREGQALMREHALGEAVLTLEGGFFRSPWGAEFVYVPGWGAYGAEKGVLHEEAEMEHCARRLARGGTVLDLGANLGTFSVNLAVRRPDLRFHAFEPVAGTCGWLRVNVRRNGLTDRVRVHRLALADRPGTLEMTSARYTDNHLVLDAGAAAGEGPRETVEVATLDDVAAREGMGPVAFIKADVEGAEPLALAGAVGLLRRDRPDLLLEVQEEHLVRYGHSIATLEAFLAREGYRGATPPEFLPHNRLYVHAGSAHAG
ncbi:FkbM family methyltransferase [Longimicrobium sp.]|uniref:FkbM family methyltransferase n=1 Tax=Longimicrobium sp. TaxID=2029185 RepID=UPI002E317C29|nr:FkbM family methyltransferase [Longimicrobium sp.]